MRSKTLRIAFILIFGLSFSLRSSALPAPEPTPAGASILDHLEHFLESIWSEIGCHIDPNGQCRAEEPGQSDTQGDIGCHIDPNGGCRE
jgi:hypothetical protein